MPLLKAVIKWWDSYKYRFVPWLRLKMQTQPTTRVIDSNLDKVVPDEEILRQLTAIFNRFKSMGRERKAPYRLKIRKSSIEGAGLGVFLSGRVPEGTVVALYPGTIYLPYESVFFQSISNKYIFKCSDGIYIDGKNKGLSRLVYKSCEGRDRISHLPSADLSWLESFESVLDTNVGQYVNNRSLLKSPNVCYQEFDFPVDFDRDLKKYIPNVYYHGANSCMGMRTVVLVSTRNIADSEELFSSYYTVIKT